MSKSSKVFNTIILLVIYIAFVTLYTITFIGFTDVIFGEDFIPLQVFLMIYALCVAVMYLSYFLHIVIHESGHLVFGLFSGYRFCSFRILSFMLVKKPDGIKLKRYSVPGTGGQCLMSPPDLIDGKIPFRLYLWGGVITNTVASVIFMILGLLFANTPWISFVFLTLAIVGLLAILTNGIPIKTKFMSNDAMSIYEMSRYPTNLKHFWTILKINSLNSDEIRLKDMDSSLFEMPSDDDFKLSVHATSISLLSYNRLIDEGNYDAARELIYKLLDGEYNVAGIHKILLNMDKLYLEVLGQNRFDVIHQILSDKEYKKFAKVFKNNLSFLRTQYAFELIANLDYDKAHEILVKFEEFAKKYPHQVDIQFERELITLAREKYEHMNNRKTKELGV